MHSSRASTIHRRAPTRRRTADIPRLRGRTPNQTEAIPLRHAAIRPRRAPILRPRGLTQRQAAVTAAAVTLIAKDLLSDFSEPFEQPSKGSFFAMWFPAQRIPERKVCEKLTVLI